MAHLDDVSEARVFAPLVLDELPGLRLPAAQQGRLLLELLSWWPLKLKDRRLLQQTTPSFQTETKVLRWDH